MAPSVRLLVLFIYPDTQLPFRVPDLLEAARTLGLEVSPVGELEPNAVHLFVDFGSPEEACRIAQRCVYVRGIFDCWAQAKDYDELLALVGKVEKARWEEHFADKTFKYTVDCFGRGRSMQEKRELIDKFQGLAHGGTVNLKEPQTNVWLMEDVGFGTGKGAEPRRLFYCLEVGLSSMRREVILKYDLKQRRYLGTTSMPSELSFMMCNMANVRQGQGRVCDCFCGTASILVSAAHFGATVTGVEIDSRVLSGKNGINIYTNFEQYQLPPPELLRGDLARRFFWREEGESFDAIITDPPYGVRAGSRKADAAKVEKIAEHGRKRRALMQGEVSATGTGEDEPADDGPAGEEAEPLILPTEGYSLRDIGVDLLDFAAQMLRIGGRLVYWLPTTELYSDDELPSHRCLKLLYNIQQDVTIRMKRRLLVFQKEEKWDPKDKAVPPGKEVDLRNLTYESEAYASYKKKKEARFAAGQRYAQENSLPNLSKAERRRQRNQQIEERKAKRAAEQQQQQQQVQPQEQGEQPPPAQ